MVFAEIKDNTCVNILECDEKFAGLFGYISLPDGYGIGDFYDGGIWTKRQHPVVKDIEDETKITVEALQQENNLLKAQLQAQSDRTDFLEDCIAEMASAVYTEK